MNQKVPEEIVLKFREYILSLSKHKKEILSYFYGADRSWRMRTMKETSEEFRMGESLISQIIGQEIGEFAYHNALNRLEAFKLWKL
jgi:DNA-directed RNA polymerase specialized sigma subunit